MEEEVSAIDMTGILQPPGLNATKSRWVCENAHGCRAELPQEHAALERLSAAGGVMRCRLLVRSSKLLMVCGREKG
jgi:hypothetical protein